MAKKEKPFDLAKIKKGTEMKLKNGQAMKIVGLYLSNDGPVLMAKADISLTASVNVPLSDTDTMIVEE